MFQYHTMSHCCSHTKLAQRSLATAETTLVALTICVSPRKVSTIAVVSAGERMFVGTGDGSLTAHECRGDTTNALKAGSFECREVRDCDPQPPISAWSPFVLANPDQLRPLQKLYISQLVAQP